jgi:hypothetical protein
MATPTSACASAGASFVPSPRHGYELTVGLLAPDQVHLVFGSCLGKKIIYTGFLSNCGGSEGVVARNHHGANTHCPQFSAIAVLPLEQLSGDASQEYFADGMTDALITELAKIGKSRAENRGRGAH